MNKLIKVILVHLFGLFDINQIRMARSAGIKSGIEKKIILYGFLAIVYGFAIYKLILFLDFKNVFSILTICFMLSSFFCFIKSILSVREDVFKSDDNDVLFSLPLSVNQVLFSKLFQVYLKNLFYVLIIMTSSLLAFASYKEDLSESFLTMYIVCSLLIPLVPIVLATIFCYCDAFLEMKFGIKKRNIIRFLFILFIIGFIYCLSKTFSGLNSFYIIYPIVYLFYMIVRKTNIFFFILYVALIVLIMILYNLIISNSYLQICSMLKGIKKRSEFSYHKSFNRRSLLGSVHKEILSLIANKKYFMSVFMLSYGISILFFVISLLFNIDGYIHEEWIIYLDNLIPFIISLICTMKIYTISAISLEQDNRFMLRTYPVSFKKVILAKYLTNLILGFGPIIIMGISLILFYDFDKWTEVFSFILPFSSLAFICFTGLTLDLRFPVLKADSREEIVNQRLLNLVPPIIAIGLIVIPFITGFVFKNYYIFLGTILILGIGILIEMLYLLISAKKIMKNLFH